MGNGICTDSGTGSTLDWLDVILGTYQNGQGSIYDDDVIDRLNSHYTAIILFAFTVLVSTLQYVGEPITCFCPAEFESGYQMETYNRIQYTNQYCWVSNTYYIPMKDQIPVNFHYRYQQELTYYQWVPLILIIMGLLFKIPRMVWTILLAYSGVNVVKLGNLTKDSQLTDPDDQERKVEYIVEYMNQWFENVQNYRAGVCVRAREKLSSVCCVLVGRHHGNYIITSVLVVKILYIANALGQLYLLNEFLGMKFNVYGYEVLKSFSDGEDWTNSPRFPRVTLCDLQIRQISNLQRWTIQCVLPINLFNEKIFIFMWFWLVLLVFLSIMSLLLTFYGTLFPRQRRSHIRKYLLLSGLYIKNEKGIVRKFVHRYLRQDGCFVLRLLCNNASDVISAQIIRQLYQLYKTKYKEKRRLMEEEL